VGVQDLRRCATQAEGGGAQGMKAASIAL
jgi:hypothetical protein